MLFIRQQDNATVHSSIKQNEKEKKIMKIEIEDARTMEEKKKEIKIAVLGLELFE